MASDDLEQWERVSAELRAYRDFQQQAWGDIDNATLGRYLANEVSADERRRVEAALNDLPELRKLTDLVRDVLGDFEPAVSSSSAAEPASVVLPFRTQLEPARPAHHRFSSRLRQCVALAAAACLLLALGLGVSRPGLFSTSPAGEPSVLDSGLAMRTAGPFADEERVQQEWLESRQEGGAVQAPVAEDHAPGHARRVAHFPPDNRLLKKGPRVMGAKAIDPAATLARDDGKVVPAGVQPQLRVERELQRAAVLNRSSARFRQQGDLDRAARSLVQAHEIWQNTLGPRHPYTVQSGQSLAQLYEVALNTPAPDSSLSLGQAVERKDGQAVLGGTDLAKDDRRPLVAFHAPTPSAPPAGVSATYHSPANGHTFGMRGANPYAYQQQSAAALHDEIVCQNPYFLKSNVAPVLTRAFREAPTGRQRASYARALGNLGPAACDAVPVLTQRLRVARQPEERQAILAALGDMGTGARAALPLLVETLEKGSPESRQAAADALVRLGPCARAAVTRLASKKEIASDALVRHVVTRLEGRDGRVGVVDDGDCFSVRTLRVSGRVLHDLADTAGVEVFVKTVPVYSPAVGKQRQEWLRRMGPRSVCVVVDRATHTARVDVTEPLQRQGLSAQKLQQLLDEDFRRNQYDRGLAKGVQFLVRNTKVDKETGRQGDKDAK